MGRIPVPVSPTHPVSRPIRADPRDTSLTRGRTLRRGSESRLKQSRPPAPTRFVEPADTVTGREVRVSARAGHQGPAAARIPLSPLTRTNPVHPRAAPSGPAGPSSPHLREPLCSMCEFKRSHPTPSLNGVGQTARQHHITPAPDRCTKPRHAPLPARTQKGSTP